MQWATAKKPYRQTDKELRDRQRDIPITEAPFIAGQWNGREQANTNFFGI